MTTCRIAAASVALAAASSATLGQIAIDPIASGVTPEDLVAAVLGADVDAFNVVYVGAPTAAGLFSGGQAAVGFDSGIVLGSGNVGFVAPTEGLNLDDGVSQGNGRPGDPDLDPFVPSFGTFDAAVLEFDFDCAVGGTLDLQFVLASEEYNEFVNGFYNDAFAIFVNGVNVALLPDGVTPVSINTVNGGNPFGVDAANPEYFVNNDCDDVVGQAAPCIPAVPIEMDGLTVVLTAAAPVEAGTNHVKIAIADGGDEAFDSNVLIRSGSFTCGAEVPEPIGGCVQSLRHWRTELRSWPLEAVSIGDVVYSRKEIARIMRKPVFGNGLILLTREMAAARLNEANGASVPPVVAAALEAGDGIAGDLVAPPVGRGRLLTSTVQEIVDVLAAFNAGAADDGPPACAADDARDHRRRSRRHHRADAWSWLWSKASWTSGKSFWPWCSTGD